ncbi:nucleotide exchange factor GrpE [Natronococcus jeotgali]|uniref:Protein GrpE n=1 Tax=Natronococcus jeotgali DSM 18795 TaxID=1227498 RepID=L9XXE3_9EURY|nr:nucleotide exchange factor GrpE [Natronococcus jeotgali]ELY66445.1 GrpE [Natronococcus jeotgali DSM 18795]
MSEDEGTNASAQGVPSEDRPDDGDGVDTDAGDESDVETAEPEPETTADETDAEAEPVEQLRAELEEAEAEIEDLEGRLKRKQADFQNYKKRAKKRQEQMKDRATEDLVERLVGVRDNLKRALEEDSDDVESLREGVEMTLREFDRVLDEEDVSEIDPEPGTETDPQRHEVMMRVDSDQPEGTVADVYTPGYEMGEKVIQNAQVTVSNGDLEDDASSDDGTDAE